ALAFEQRAGTLDQRRAEVAVVVRGSRARPRPDGSPHGRRVWQQMLTESTSARRCLHRHHLGPAPAGEERTMSPLTPIVLLLLGFAGSPPPPSHPAVRAA